MLRLNNLKIYEDLNETQLIQAALKKYRIDPSQLLEAHIVRKSIDARDKSDVHYVYCLDVKLKDERHFRSLRYQKPTLPKIENHRTSSDPVVIVGAGPAGLFCALELIKYGVKPIIIEQGEPVEERLKSVQTYRQSGHLNPSSNVQFGEGGAGTFSDGKLQTGVNSPYIQTVLDTFVTFGAPKEISYLAKPHLGTDNLTQILVQIRQYIESQGGRYYFNCRFEDYRVCEKGLEVICSNQTFKTDALVLAIGHSARATFERLKEKGLAMRRKNFALGVRIEHAQSTINESQYGNQTKLNLPPADYKLIYHDGERVCYSFCMCPGGEVMASASEPETIVTNGMSEFRRDKENANSALLVNVMPKDFDSDDVLSGMELQRKLEHAAYQLGGSDGSAPVQRVEDFEKGVASDHLGKVKPSYQPGVRLADLNTILPDYVSETLKKALPYFETKIKGFNDPDALLTGIESRSSSPVTILRNEQYRSENPYIYPCGEGAGYAGGITTAAIDGIHVAHAILKNGSD